MQENATEAWRWECEGKSEGMSEMATEKAKKRNKDQESGFGIGIETGSGEKRNKSDHQAARTTSPGFEDNLASPHCASPPKWGYSDICTTRLAEPIRRVLCTCLYSDIELYIVIYLLVHM